MNRSESKYFNTAIRMDKAFLELLEKKDFAYITVKEICEMAGVNRSTFYLHYETIGDLLSESSEYIIQQFLSYMQKDSNVFIEKMHNCSIDELYLITPEYLVPYLSFIGEHQRLFRTTLENSAILQLENSYAGLSKYVLMPILERHGIPVQERNYMITFYIHGLMAIITEWVKNDCIDSIEQIIRIMQTCIPNHIQVLNARKENRKGI